MSSESEVERFEVGNLTVKIEYDPDPPNPRTDWEHPGTTMVAFHRRYNLGDESDYKADNYESWDQLKLDIELKEDVAMILPLYLHDHSGLAMRTTDFGDRWDSGQVGWIFMTKDAARDEFGKLTKKSLEKVKKLLESEVDTYNDYLGGAVYGFVIEDAEGEELDALWGIYDLKHARGEAKLSAESILKSQKQSKK